MFDLGRNGLEAQDANLYAMLCFSGHGHPFHRRLDHMICEVPDIKEAFELFLSLGFPEAWPIGRFWPQGQTAAVALGRINLEFLQLDEGSPKIAQIRTLVFEPVSMDAAIQRLKGSGLDADVKEKWESNPELLALRGFDPEECKSPQLICRNATFGPQDRMPVDFFDCEYSPKLKQRLAPSAFPGLLPVDHVVLGTPTPWENWHTLGEQFGLSEGKRAVDIVLDEEPVEFPEVIRIISDRGPIDLKGWPARFQFA